MNYKIIRNVTFVVGSGMIAFGEALSFYMVLSLFTQSDSKASTDKNILPALVPSTLNGLVTWAGQCNFYLNFNHEDEITVSVLAKTKGEAAAKVVFKATFTFLYLSSFAAFSYQSMSALLEWGTTLISAAHRDTDNFYLIPDWQNSFFIAFFLLGLPIAMLTEVWPGCDRLGSHSTAPGSSQFGENFVNFVAATCFHQKSVALSSAAFVANAPIFMLTAIPPSLIISVAVSEDVSLFIKVATGAVMVSFMILATACLAELVAKSVYIEANSFMQKKIRLIESNGHDEEANPMNLGDQSDGINSVEVSCWSKFRLTTGIATETLTVSLSLYFALWKFLDGGPENPLALSITAISVVFVGACNHLTMYGSAKTQFSKTVAEDDLEEHRGCLGSAKSHVQHLRTTVTT